MVLTDRTRARNRLKGLRQTGHAPADDTAVLARLWPTPARVTVGRWPRPYRARLQREWEHLRSVEARLQILSNGRAGPNR